jgi:hypothetical protein
MQKYTDQEGESHGSSEKGWRTEIVVPQRARKSSEGHARVQAWRTEVGRPQKGKKPEAGNRYCIERGTPGRRGCSSPEGRQKGDQEIDSQVWFQARRHEKIGLPEELGREKDRQPEGVVAQERQQAAVSASVYAYAAGAIVKRRNPN